jgi:hypothetical protein
MIGSPRAGPLCGRAAARIGIAAAALLALVAAPAAQTQPTQTTQPSQTAQPESEQPPADAAAPTSAPGNKPGFIDAFGHWIGDSVSGWNSGLKGAADAAKDAADAAGAVTRDTADAVARLPGARVIEQHATCPTAPNGAPDCRSAAETICKAHGFESGSSIDFQTAEKCPPIALNRRNDEPPSPCVIESYVTRSLCQ